MGYWILLTVTHIALVVTTEVDNDTDCSRDTRTASCDFQKGDFCGWNNTAGHDAWSISSTGQSGGGDYYARAVIYVTRKYPTLQSPVLCLTDVPYTLSFRCKINCTRNRCQLLVKMRKGPSRARDMGTCPPKKSGSGWATFVLNMTNSTQHSIEFVATRDSQDAEVFEIGIDQISFQPATTKTTSMLISQTTALTTTTAPTLTSELHTATAAATRTTPSHDSQDDTENTESESQQVRIAVGVTVSLLVVGVVVAAIVIWRRKGCFHISCHLKATQNTDVTPAGRLRQSVASPAYSRSEERFCITTPRTVAVKDEVNKKTQTAGTRDHTSQVTSNDSHTYNNELSEAAGGDSPYEIGDWNDTRPPYSNTAVKGEVNKKPQPAGTRDHTVRITSIDSHTYNNDLSESAGGELQYEIGDWNDTPKHYSNTVFTDTGQQHPILTVNEYELVVAVDQPTAAYSTLPHPTASIR